MITEEVILNLNGLNLNGELGVLMIAGGLLSVIEDIVNEMNPYVLGCL